MTEQLRPFESSARALAPRWSQLAVLPSDIKREAVLVSSIGSVSTTNPADPYIALNYLAFFTVR
jgi:hypothetical protein